MTAIQTDHLGINEKKQDLCAENKRQAGGGKQQEAACNRRRAELPPFSGFPFPSLFLRQGGVQLFQGLTESLYVPDPQGRVKLQAAHQELFRSRGNLPSQ